jgi:hypothetical protein
MLWFKSRYTTYLEEEVERLRAKVGQLEAELILAVRQGEISAPHNMNKTDTRATCSCGWLYDSDDPGKLQTAISSHYREKIVHRGRKSWPQVKAMLETTSQKEKYD